VAPDATVDADAVRAQLRRQVESNRIGKLRGTRGRYRRLPSYTNCEEALTIAELTACGRTVGSPTGSHWSAILW